MYNSQLLVLGLHLPSEQGLTVHVVPSTPQLATLFPRHVLVVAWHREAAHAAGASSPPQPLAWMVTRAIVNERAKRPNMVASMGGSDRKGESLPRGFTRLNWGRSG